MGKWLAALQHAEKESGKPPRADPQNPQNPTEGFEGPPSGPIPNLQGWDEVDWQFAVEERAAILEFEEGLPRPEAEALAAEQVVDQRRRQLQ